MENSTWQVVLAIIAVSPGLLALWRQFRKDQHDKASAEETDKRSDFLADNTAAGQISETALRLVQPLRERIGELEAELAKKDDAHRKEMMDLSMRLDVAERKISELERVNENLVEEKAKKDRENERLKNRIKEIQRLLGTNGS